MDNQPDDNPPDRDDTSSNTSGDDSGGRDYDEGNEDPNRASWQCYITTACVKAMDLPDNCLELRALRELRDSYVLNLPGGKGLWEEYKATAPRIITAIDSREEPKKIYEMIFTNYIRPISQLALQGSNESALLQYQEMTTWLKKEFLDETRAKRKKVLEEVVAEKRYLLDYATRNRIAYRTI